MEDKIFAKASLIISFDADMLKEYSSPYTYNISGNIEDIIKSQHLNTLAVLARAITDKENPDKDYIPLLEKFIEKYKIQNT